MKDVANFATFVSKTLIFSSQKMDEFNFKLAQYYINKIFELTKSCIWVISKWMWWSGDWTLCCAILVWNHTCNFKSNSRCALIQFWNHAYDLSPKYTPLSSITISYHCLIIKKRSTAFREGEGEMGEGLQLFFSRIFMHFQALRGIVACCILFS